jgi:recombination protein RecR
MRGVAELAELDRLFGALSGAGLFATVEGQSTAHYLTDQLAGCNVTISRLAHGVPVGGELDYLDEGTLAAAVKARKAM